MVSKNTIISKEEEITNDIVDDGPPELETVDAPQQAQNNHGKKEKIVKSRYLVLIISKERIIRN